MTKNLWVVVPPNWHGHNPAFPEFVELPQDWHGSPVIWEKGYSISPVFIGQVTLRDGNDVYLFGARFELSKASVKGRKFTDGFFVEFFIAECPEDLVDWQRLHQKRGAVYASNPTKGDHISAEDLSSNVVRSLSHRNPPTWKADDAKWPTYETAPMDFVGQFSLPENEVTRQFLTWDMGVFLFWKQSSDGSCYKITTQDLDYQSASDHYANE